MVDSKLKTLLVLNENGSYTKTAEILHMTQPAVSQHIKALEGEFGIGIFNKTDKGIVPTAQGEILIQYARRAITLFELGKKQIEDSRNNVFSVTVGTTPTSESALVSEALGRFALSTSGLHIRIVSSSISVLYDKLESYEIDLAIIEGHNGDPRYRSLLLDTDNLMLAVSPEGPWAKKSLIRVDDLKEQKLILRLPNSGIRQLFETSLEAQGLVIKDLNVVLEVEDCETIKSLVMKGFGASVLPRSLCLDDEKNQRLVLLPIEGMSMIREISLVYPKDFEHQDIIDGIARSYQSAKRN